MSYFIQRRPAKQKSVLRQWIRWFAAHQIEVSAVPIAIILGANSVSGPPVFSLKALHPFHIPSIDPTYHLESIPSRFLFLSYVDPKTGLCLKGPDDFYLVVFWVFVWTFLREASMRWFWAPLGRYSGIKSEGTIKRFAEQGWGLMYAASFWMLGMYIYETSPYAHSSGLLLPSRHLWTGYPHFSLPPLTKFYYLVQMAFWVQTMIALNIEKRRKDYWQMFAHHVITVLLCTLSYAANFTRVGNLILCIMDMVDIILPLAKMVKYANYPNVADVIFGIFLLAWVITRHIFFPTVLYSVVFTVREVLDYKWDPEAGWFYSVGVQVGFAGLLVGLQIMMCMWLYMILKVVVKVLKGESADDVRSDSEDLEDTFDEDLKDSACEMAKSIDHISEKASSQEHLRRRSVSAL